MSIHITLYNNKSDNIVVSKNIVSIKSISGTFFEPCDVQNAKIIVKYDTAIFKANYFYISDFSRYYYVTNVTILDGRQVEITGHCDVLMSFDVKKITGVVARQENNWNMYYSDSTVRQYAYTRTQIKKFPTKLPTSNQYIMTVAGGN